MRRTIIIQVNVPTVTTAQAVGATLALIIMGRSIVNPATAAINPTIIMRVNVQIVTVQMTGVTQPLTMMDRQTVSPATIGRRSIMQVNVQIATAQTIGILTSRMMA